MRGCGCKAQRSRGTKGDRKGVGLPEGTLTMDEAFAALAGNVNQVKNVGAHAEDHVL